MSGPYRSAAPPGEEEEKETASSGKVDLGAVRSQHSWPIGASLVALAAGGWNKVAVHERGLRFTGTDVAGRTVVPFEEIDAIFYTCEALALAARLRVTFVTFDGKRFSLPNSLDDLDGFLDALDRAVTHPLTRRAKGSLARGETLTFGPVVLELDGVVVKGDRLSWRNLSHVSAERDSIIFYAMGPLGRFAWVKLVDVPHPSVLLDVLRMRTRVVLDGLRLRVGDEA